MVTNVKAITTAPINGKNIAKLSARTAKNIATKSKLEFVYLYS